MPRFLALVASLAFLAGCSGAAVTQSPLNARETLTQRSRPITPQANCPSAPAGSGILPDGDFSRAPQPGGNGDVVYSQGQLFAPSWEVTNGTIDFNSSTFWNMAGLCSVDLDGNNAGGIKITAFATKRHVSYTVTFLLSGNGCCGGGNPPVVKTMKIQAAGQSAVFTWDTSNNNDVEHGIYAQRTWGFKARSDLTDLQFLSLDNQTSTRGAVVAAISVTRN
jgi:hypothetical protein